MRKKINLRLNLYRVCEIPTWNKAEKTINDQCNKYWRPFWDITIERALDSYKKRSSFTWAYIKEIKQINGRNAILFYAYRPSRGSSWWQNDLVKQKYLLFELLDDDPHPKPRRLSS